jgi:hypothetical protein
LSSQLFASIAIGYDKKNHDHFSDWHLCWLMFIFTLARNILYVNSQHSFECNLARNLPWVPLPKMWDYSCIWGTSFSLFWPSNAHATDWRCKAQARCPEVFWPSPCEAGKINEEIITLWNKFLWSLNKILKDSLHGIYFCEGFLDVICFMVTLAKIVKPYWMSPSSSCPSTSFE